MSHCLNYEVLGLLLKSLNIPQRILFDFGQNSEDSLVYIILVLYILKFSSDIYTLPTSCPPSVFKLLACFS